MTFVMRSASMASTDGLTVVCSTEVGVTTMKDCSRPRGPEPGTANSFTALGRTMT